MNLLHNELNICKISQCHYGMYIYIYKFIFCVRVNCWIRMTIPFKYILQITNLWMVFWTPAPPNGCLKPYNYPMVICHIAIENDPVEIVDFPINSMMIFHSYVSLPEAKHGYLPSINWCRISSTIHRCGKTQNRHGTGRSWSSHGLRSCPQAMGCYQNSVPIINGVP